jgi:hypothetical protein
MNVRQLLVEHLDRILHDLFTELRGAGATVVDSRQGRWDQIGPDRYVTINDVLVAISAHVRLSGYPPGHLRNLTLSLTIDADPVRPNLRFGEGKAGFNTARMAQKVLAHLDRVPCPRCFQELGLEGHPTLDEVQAAYRRLARQHHPDRGGDPARFVTIQQAYERAVQLLQDDTPPAG